MKKILAIVLMMAVLACPAVASGEAPAETAAAPAVAQDAAAQAPHYVLQVIEPATCTENGVSAYVNAESGEVLFTFETAATGHVPNASEPTCTDPVVCVNCGEVLEPAAGHAYTYQYDAVQNEDGGFASFGTWACDKCGDVVEATEGNAVYYYGQEEAAPAEEAVERAAEEAAPAAEDASAADAAPAAPAEEASEEAAPAVETSAAAGSNYDPSKYNWASIEIMLALIIVVIGAVLMLSFGKKKNG